jgi:D-alanyl-D-alanine carboxypeptidase/D-alanyl-D-alanine-endopeptidase (penicillin-binding protein 4)
MALAAILKEHGILSSNSVVNSGVNSGPGRAPQRNLRRYYRPENVVAEHVSAPLSEEIKVTLKTSQNLHASMMPYDLGALVARATTDSGGPAGPASRGIEQAGYDLEREFLLRAGLDLSGASQGDGAGGSRAAYFTPDFIVQYLVYMSRQKDFRIFHDSLPILGRDGTLWNIQKDSPAAGHVYAKTGTFGTYDALNRRTMLNGKGLAGYLTTLDGRHLVFALYINSVLLPDNQPDPAQSMVGQALGEIAAAAYSAQPPAPDTSALTSSAAASPMKDGIPAEPAATEFGDVGARR